MMLHVLKEKGEWMSGLPDTIPGWLMNDWSQYLRSPLVDQVLNDEELQALFQAMIARWRSRPKPLKERSIVKYLGFTRIWISELSLTELTRYLNPETQKYEHRALRFFLFPTKKYAELVDQSRAKVDWRNEHQLLLPDPLAIINRLIELLTQSADWAPLAVALAGLTGRRVGEVLLSGTVSWKSAYSVDFSGRLKRKGAPDKTFEIPTACEAQRVVDGWERLRSHPDLQANYPQFFEEISPERMNAVLRQLNRDLSPIVRKAADYYFQDLVPMLEEDQEDKEVQRWGVYTHLFRSIYSTIAIWLYAPVNVHPDAFASYVLGHTYYAQTEEGGERLNYASGQHYHRYGISDGNGNHDGRRGIRLRDPNYPGVKVIAQFEKEYAMQQVLQENVSQKKKKRERKPSKTGFSSIRPRSETRQWFDQVAEENQLTWKTTDDTLKLLLETYEAHKRCQQAGVSVPTQMQITPTFLGLDDQLAALVEEGMRAAGQGSFLAYLKQALVRESRTQIGLAKSRKDREGEDVTKLPWESIKGVRRPEASFERIRRAIGAIIDYNRGCSDPNGFWFINVNLLRDYIGASPDFITPVLKANQELIARHHEHFKITRSHNGRPVPKTDKLSLEVLPIPDDPKLIRSLGEIVLPGQEEKTAEDDC